MAEVLITLGIIGIVAAMTLPTLVNKINSKQYKVAYKKAYSSLSNAFLMMKNNGEYLETPTYTLENNLYAPNIGENFKIISKYFKATKTCFNNNTDECWQCEGGQSGNADASGPYWLGCFRTSYAFVDASGMSWLMYNNREWPVLVDVNGKQKPNKLGQDRFVLQFAASSDRGAKYNLEADTILPWGDIIEKGRWCPSGNCLYQTWLLE